MNVKMMINGLLQKSTVATATATAFISIGCLIPEAASAASITATVQGDTNPPTINGQSLQNGDFLITPNNNTFLGNGIDEFTNWSFDFNNDLNLQKFLDGISQGPLTSAQLTLTLSPKSLFSTDSTGIPSVKGIANLPNIPGIPNVGGTGTVVLDLLNDYEFTSEQILGAFNSGDANSIPWTYQDDAIISFAQLKLEAKDAQSVPEPITGLVLAAGIGGAALKRTKNKSKKS